MTSKGERPSCRAQSSRASWMRARVCKAAQGLATIVAIATAFAFAARAEDYTVIDSATALALGGASGGDEIRRIDNDDGTFDLVHIFTNTAAAQPFTISDGQRIAADSFRLLVVGGGGSGYGNCGGGGGAGGVVTNTIAFPAGAYEVTVGAGGLSTAHEGANSAHNGADSVISNKIAQAAVVSALGGGHGGGYNKVAATSGGSGGGGGHRLAGASGTSDQGNAGGNGYASSDYYGGGGGGAGAAGSNGTNGNGGAGGTGIELDITGEAVWYAGGGGGAGYNANTGGAGGKGGGGAGGRASANGHNNVVKAGFDGEPGTGGGGGGGASGGGSTAFGGAGGSGIVVIRYTVLDILDDGSVLYTFAKTNTVNQLTLPKAALTRILAVGGGGGGAGPGSATTAQGGAGGGGAGGMIDTNNYVLAGGTYSITVGAGGAGGAATTANPGNMGENGGDTCIATNGVDILRAYGGGGGGIRADGNPGGSGGGGSRYSNNATAGPKYGGSASQPDSTWGGYGNKGGDSSAAYYQGGAGGGGAGGVGGSVSAANTGADGGLGRISDITGTDVFYAAGGGGGARTGTGGSGGSEIGGNGGGGANANPTAATAGKDGTGSGGGGGRMSGAGGAGGSGIVYIRIFRYMPDKPVDTNFTYTGAIFAAYAEDSYAEKAYTLEGTYEASAVGHYTFTATLNDGFCWSDGSTGSVEVNWQILPKPIVISRFTQEGWQLTEAAAAPDPVLVADPTPHASEVTYYYSSSSTDWTGATTVKPTTVGTWFVKPQFDSTNFTYDNDNVPVAEFQLWDFTEGKYPDYLGYHADIAAVDTGTNRLVKVVVSEGVPFGFSYSKTREDGSDIRFTAVTNGVVTLLAYTTAMWDATDESVFWVSVPAGVDGITMNWGVILDAEGNEIEIPDSPDGSEVMGGVVIPDELYADARAYHTCITVTNYGGAALTDFPMAVRLGDGSPAGFTYATAASDGGDLVFSLADGTLLPSEIEQWDPSGASLVWVKVPTYQDGTQIWLHWGKKAELTIPAATEVWSAYAGVWHMGSGTDEMAGTYGTAATKDSTGNNADATVGSASSGVSAVFGSGLNSTSNSGGPILKIPAGVQIDNLTNAAFTASFWAKIDNNASGKTGWPALFARRSAHGGTGYGVRVVADTINPSVGTNIRIYYGASGNYGTWNNDTRIAGGTWQRHDVMYKPGRVEWYIDGVFQGAAYSGLTAWTDYGYVSIGGWGEGSDSLVGAVDELRMRSGGINTALIAAETNQWALIESGAETYTAAATVIYTPAADAIEPTVVTPYARFVNRWTIEPTFSATYLNRGLNPSDYLTLGQALYGTVTNVYYTVGGEPVADMTTAPAGSYTVKVWVPEGTSGTRSWPALAAYDWTFTLLATSPYSGLDDATRNGRVLLVNDDANGDYTIEGQSYYLTNATASATYWLHDNESTVELMNYLGQGTVHELLSTNAVDELCGGTRLWYMEHVRIGNTYPDSLNEAASKNFLPWSATGRSTLDATETQLGQQKDSANLLLQNVLDAALYSPCYTNGIGTVYFDAVNGWTNTDDGSEYQLVVEYATAATVDGEQVLPTDENAQLVTEATVVYDDDDNPILVPATTNYFARVTEWRPVAQLVIPTDGAGGFEAPATVLTNQLAVTAGGGHQRFYRVAAVINCYAPCRFRIRRVSINTTYSENPDASAFILLDNVIVSFPPMKATAEPEGWFDADKHGKATLGVEKAFLTPFPAVDEALMGRAKMSYVTNPGAAADTSQFVTSATLLYRWRYLDQAFAPADASWREVLLDPSDNFTATEPLTLPEGLVGDVEFRYVTVQNAPFYVYHDYAGYATADGLGGYYTEQTPIVTNALASAAALESRGTDWFVRLREGRSAFESLEIATVSEDWATTNDVVQMELVGDHTWRGCYQTKTNAADTAVYFQIRARNEQTADTTEFATNVTYWALAADADEVPVSSILDAEGEDAWARLPIDAATGHLMFQVDDQTRSITVVHADYQNFNAWSDAKQSWFVGTSTYTNSAASGTAAAKMKFAADFGDWVDMPRTTNDWCVPYLGWTDVRHMGNHAANAEFTTDSSGAWDVGAGYWVPQWYDDARDNMGVALQMMGQGKGYVQLTRDSLLPRGIGTLSFNARLAQAVAFDDFAYYDGGSKLKMTNYTFTARVAFDANSSQDFSGQAALSVIAYYRPRVGCYELRIEPVEAATQNAAKPGGIQRSSKLRMTLRRWSWNTATGQLEDEALGCYTNNFKIPVISQINSGVNTATSGNNPIGYLPLYISVSNDTSGVSCIMAGVGRTPLAYNSTIASAQSGKNFHSICYRDTSARKLTAGTYGTLATNCKGIFLRPYTYDRPIPFLSNFTTNNKADQYSNSAIAFNGTESACHDDIKNGEWVTEYGRMQTYDTSGDTSLWGLMAWTNTLAQTLTVYSSTDVGKSEPTWTPVTNLTVRGFGTSSGTTAYTIPLYLTETRLFKLAVDGNQQSARRDVVIDSLRLDAWRGADWENLGLLGEGNARYVPGWTTEATGSEGHTNFTFTSGWITNHTVLLSARRTQPGKPAAIKSPLMDGAAGYGRGSGLGMIAYSYRDAQPNVRLLVQIATNGVGTANIATINNLDESTWTTVATNDFADCTAAELKGGVRSVYLGLHGVKGVMRIVMDPAVVNAVTNEFDASKFGDIYITGVSCTDEPVLDETSWWGWNLRAVGSTEEADPERRMLLGDLSTSDNDLGLSMALNNSPDYDIAESDAAAYKEHMPFVQSPTFAQDIVGEVQFRARKYVYTSSDTNATAAAAFNDQPAFVALYGATSGSEGTDANWKLLTTFAISNTTYATFSHKTEPNDSYSAFRLSVRGVDGLANYMARGHVLPDGAESAVRVLLDEVLVTEAVRARVGFRNVGAFRGYQESAGRNYVMQDDLWVPNVPSAGEQPLCNEPWGVQCEIFKAQLPDEIDFETVGKEPTVRLHYIEGTVPWGYLNWVTNAAAKVVTLTRASDSNLVFRSSYKNGADNVLPIVKTPGLAYQYALEVVFYQAGSSTPVTNWLDSAGWTKPAWYNQIDYNAQYGGGESRNWSAYCILDTVAPGWAWINEANLYGRTSASWSNVEADRQYVEIAAPVEASLSGWKVRMLEALDSDDTVVTNTIAEFGAAGLKDKKSATYAASDMSFHVIAGPLAMSAGTLKKADGTLDGTWSFDYPTSTFNGTTGEILANRPFGIQLVRASGIVEHEIVTIGTNWWANSANYAAAYHPTNTVNFFNDKISGARFFYAGADEGDKGDSVGVFASQGEDANVWTNDYVMTPGRINANQTITAHPTPNGETIIVSCNLGTGHLRQSVGDSVDSADSQIVYLNKGSTTGLTITYTTDPWYVLAAVTTGSVAHAFATNSPVSYTAVVGVNASNNFTVVGSAEVEPRLAGYGLGADNPYTEAVVDWLGGGRTLKGAFANPSSQDLFLAEYRKFDGTVLTNLTLTQMYWLDMDPTASLASDPAKSALALYGGMSKAPSVTPRAFVTEAISDTETVLRATLTNMTMAIKMWITNENVSAAAWAPYTLRSLTPGRTSSDADRDLNSWTSVTFKITGLLYNGKTDFMNRKNWGALRWFVFDDNSFDANYESVIEIKDPYSPSQIGWTYWGSWFREHGGRGSPTSNIFYFWSLDENLQPIGVELLKKENKYE